MGNKFIRKHESSVSAAGSQQEPAENQKSTEMGHSDVTSAQQTAPAEGSDVVMGQEVAQTPCLPNEVCASAPEPTPEACVEVDFEEKDPSSSSSPPLDLSTPLSPPQPTITPPDQTPIPEEKVADVAAAEGSPDATEAAVSSVLDPDATLKAGDAGNLEAATDGNSEQEESLSKCLNELSLMGKDAHIIDDTPSDMGVSAELIRGSEDP